MTSKQELTARLAEVTARLVMTETDLEEAELAKKRADKARDKAWDDLREFRKLINDALTATPAPPVGGTLMWDGVVTITPSSESVMSALPKGW